MKKKVIITGGSSGIGKYLIKQLLLSKFFVINISRKKTKINSKNYENILVNNLTSNKEIDNVCKLIKKKHKTFFALINNAGGTYPGYEFGNFKKNIDINLISVFYITKKLAPLIKKNGSIINISSIAGNLALPNNPGYNASKAAMNSLTKSFANDFNKKNIKVNALALGYFKTNMTKKSFRSKIKKRKIEKNTIIGRWGKLNEIWGPIKFLLHKSSNYIIGQTITVDGGWSIKGLK